MAGLVDHSATTVRHHCRPPAIRRFGDCVGPGRNRVPTVVTLHPEGARFHCDGCGTVWVVWNKPPTRGRYCYMAGGLEWRRETRRDRRQRLGLRWWQR